MLIDGRKIAQKIERRLAHQIKRWGAKPHLAVILVGEDPASPGAGRYLASKIYIGKKKEAAERVGIEFSLFEENTDSADEKLISRIERLNSDPSINGVIVQLPLPKGMDVSSVVNLIAPEKDVDGVTSENLSLLASGNPRFIPATAGAVWEVLKDQKVKIEGSDAVVVGRGRVAGLPIALLLLSRDATVTICHSKTKDLSSHTRQADILVSAVGKPGIIKPKMVKRGAAVIDVGISRLSAGKLAGDVDPGVEKVARFLTPVPGGIGPITVAKLLENTVLAFQRQGP